MSVNFSHATLAEVSRDVSYGYTASATNEPVGPKFLRITDIQGGVVNWGSVPYCVANESARKKNKLEYGDIVIARTGNSTGENFFFDGDEEAVFASYLIRFRIDPKLANPYFVWLQLRTQSWWNYVSGSKSGSAQAGANAKVLGRFELQLPDRTIQDQVEQVIRNFNDKLLVNANINQTLEQMAQAIFKSWFVDFEPVKAKIAALEAGGSEEDALLAAMQAISGKGEAELTRLQAEQPEQYTELRTTAELFPSAMQGEIPEGWEFQQLKTLCRVINGRAFKNSEFKASGTPIVRIQNLSGKGKTVYSDLDLPQDKLINKEDFIYAWSATFGPFIWRGERSIYHYHIWKMDVHEEVVSRYFMYLSMFRKTEQMKNAGTGSIFTHLTKKIMESQDILIGTPELNKKFSQMIEPIFLNISALHKESMHLQSLRDELLPQLISGELSVSEAEGQLEKAAEPANV